MSTQNQNQNQTQNQKKKPPSEKGSKAAAAARQEKSAHPDRYWRRRVQAAYLLMLGLPQEEVARVVGRCPRSLRNWMADSSWERAREEAREFWFGDTADVSRAAVYKSIKSGNAELGFRFLERVDPRLAPPKMTFEHGAVGGGPIQFLIAGPEHPTN